ncbi:MAG: LysR family transcriptional regulator, partial [Stellaceae bacterium]
MMRNRELPPLMALRAFEAAARHRNFARAADELGVSAGAVSHQVKLLERWVGRPLFERRPNGVFVTAAGRELGAETSVLMDGLALAALRSRERKRGGPVTIVSQFSLAAKWLAPRLGRMRARWPELDIRLNALPQEIDPANYEGDLFIYFSPGFAAGFVHDPVAQGS